MLLGSKRVSLNFKGNCIVQQGRVETESWKSCGALFKRFFSWTNDAGVERQFNRIHFANQHDSAFAWWRNLPAEDNEYAVVDDDDDDQDAEVSARHTLDINGLFHAMENIQKRLLMQLESWRETEPLLEEVVRLFHKMHLRKSFNYQCLVRNGLQAVAQEEFKTGPPLLGGGRAWFVLRRCIGWLDSAGRPSRQIGRSSP